jgi:hypothetical protein
MLSVMFCSIASHVVFDIMIYQTKSEIKKKIKRGIPDQKLHQLSFSSKHQPNWTKIGKEFQFNGRLYDVVKTKKDGVQIIYYCINDKEESRLFAKLGTLVIKEFSHKKNPKGTSLISVLKAFYVVKSFDALKVNKFSEITLKKDFCSSYIGILDDGHKEIPSPPPLS